jgi:hypothetical protein
MAKGIPVGQLLCQEIRNCRVLRIHSDEGDKRDGKNVRHESFISGHPFLPP